MIPSAYVTHFHTETGSGTQEMAFFVEHVNSLKSEQRISETSSSARNVISLSCLICGSWPPSTICNVNFYSGQSLAGHVLQRPSCMCPFSSFSARFNHAVKLVYKDHAREQQSAVLYSQVVFMRRFNNMESIPQGTCEMWSL